MKLETGEIKIFEEGASHYYNFIAQGGMLTMTNKRLCFSPKSASEEHSLEIDLSQVTDIHFFKSFFISPNGLSVMLKDGRIENFIVDDRQVWKRRILQALGHIAE